MSFKISYSLRVKTCKMEKNILNCKTPQYDQLWSFELKTIDNLGAMVKKSLERGYLLALLKQKKYPFYNPLFWAQAFRVGHNEVFYN